MRRKELTRKEMAAVRKAVKAEFPDLKFTIRKTDFTDLLRDHAYFLHSDEWHYMSGCRVSFERTKEIVAEIEPSIIVSVGGCVIDDVSPDSPYIGESLPE